MREEASGRKLRKQRKQNQTVSKEECSNMLNGLVKKMNERPGHQKPGT